MRRLVRRPLRPLYVRFPCLPSSVRPFSLNSPVLSSLVVPDVHTHLTKNSPMNPIPHPPCISCNGFGPHPAVLSGGPYHSSVDALVKAILRRHLLSDSFGYATPSTTSPDAASCAVPSAVRDQAHHTSKDRRSPSSSLWPSPSKHKQMALGGGEGGHKAIHFC